MKNEACELVEHALEGDTIITLGMPDGPYDEVPKADPKANLICGGCGKVLLKGWSKRTTEIVLAAPARLLGRCIDCQSLNLIPSARHKTDEEIKAEFSRGK